MSHCLKRNLQVIPWSLFAHEYPGYKKNMEIEMSESEDVNQGREKKCAKSATYRNTRRTRRTKRSVRTHNTLTVDKTTH